MENHIGRIRQPWLELSPARDAREPKYLSMLVACESCTQPMKLDAPAEGERFECPRCGHQFAFAPPAAKRVAGAARSTGQPPASPSQQSAAKPKPDRAATAGYPPSDGPEQDILTLRPSIARNHPLEVLGLGLMALAGVGGGLWGLVRDWPQPWLVVCLVSALLALATLGVMKLASLGSQIRITSKRLIDRDGLLHRHTSEVLHKDVRNIRVDQTLAQRLLGVGSLAIFTGGEDEPDIFMDKVPNPDKVRTILDLYRPL